MGAAGVSTGEIGSGAVDAPVLEGAASVACGAATCAGAEPAALGFRAEDAEGLAAEETLSGVAGMAVGAVTGGGPFG